MVDAILETYSIQMKVEYGDHRILANATPLFSPRIYISILIRS